MPEGLFESEFFGHVKGAFTGALKDKPGRFELADGGTLFLDEIGEVPLAMQAKLLRVLQEQELERVGDTRTRKVNVRVIAASNRDLKEEVDEGRFRQDLFYRLSVFPIEVPPLRERREDIAPLVAHFVRQSARRMNRSEPQLSKTALDQLTTYHWPGNVRELQNSVERAIILWREGPLTFDLPASQPTQNTERSKSGGEGHARDPRRTKAPGTGDHYKRFEADQRKGLGAGRCGGTARHEAIDLGVAHLLVGHKSQNAELSTPSLPGHSSPQLLWLNPAKIPIQGECARLLATPLQTRCPSGTI